MNCGHDSSLMVKSVESDYSCCELCECRDRLRDALTMERELSAEVKELKARESDLAMLVRRLAYRLEKACPGITVAAQANDYLSRKGLHGSILRADAFLEGGE